MLSIKRRSGAHIFREEAAFRRSEQGWPNWGELGPILLRSAGIAGIAGVIMVIATGDILFTGPVRTASVQPEAANTPDAAPADGAGQVVAARDLSAEPVIGAPVVEAPIVEAQIVEEPPVEAPFAATQVTEEPVVEEPLIEQAAPVVEQAVQEAPVQEEPQAIASAPEAPILDPRAPAMDAPGTFEPLAFVRTPTTQDPQSAAPGFASIGTFSRQPTPPKMTGSVEPQERQVAAPQVAASSPIFDQPVALRGTQSEADGPEQPAGAGSDVSVVALATTDRARSAPIDRSGEAGDPATWVEASAACPRDWLDQGDGPDADFRASSDCEPTVALAAVEPSPDEGAAEEEGAVLHEALESAAATHALKLSGFIARVPLVKPETPAWALKKRKARSTYKKRRADWPDEPPPNCGTLHAYWRFVDRKKGTKEWYCR